jgi:transposase-like protein
MLTDDEKTRRQQVVSALKYLAEWAKDQAGRLDATTFRTSTYYTAWEVQRDRVERLFLQAMTKPERTQRKKGRPKIKLPEDEIRTKEAAGVSVARLAREYGVSRPTIYRVLERREKAEPRWSPSPQAVLDEFLEKHRPEVASRTYLSANVKKEAIITAMVKAGLGDGDDLARLDDSALALKIMQAKQKKAGG